MAQLQILQYPDPRLRTRAAPVETVDAEIKALVADLFDTMYAVGGIGLAATQVNVHRRVLVADVSEDKSQPLALINPQLLAKDGVDAMEEGCLSIPGFYEPVERARHIRVQALNVDGTPFEMEAEGLLAVCIQHEMDHLEGKLFVDYLSELKRSRIRRRLEKQHRQDAAAAPTG